MPFFDLLDTFETSNAHVVSVGMSRSVPNAPASDVTDERVIATARLLLATGGLIAVVLDPAQRPYALFKFAVLIAYMAFAVILALISRRPHSNFWHVTTHEVEIGLICLIIGYTESPDSPFVVYFTFLLFVAMLRWQGRGVLLTAAVLVAILLLFSVSSLLINLDRTEVDRLIVRNVYLLVAAGLFAFLGDQLGRSRQRSERLRLAEELHDGLLQALTAARLKLHAAGAGAGDKQRQSLLSVAEVLGEEQRQLRLFIERSRTDQLDGPGHVTDCLEELRSHVRHLRKLWDCDVELKAPDETLDLADRQRHAVKRLIDEGVANAVTHGHATRVEVTLFQDPRSTGLTIKDNGSGLQRVTGDFDQDMLDRQNLGPRSLHRRIVQLGGSLRLNSSPQGVELQIALPRLTVPEARR